MRANILRSLCQVAVKKTRKYYKDEKLLIQVGLKIREIRQNKNITQELLANHCEIDYSQVNRVELGKVNFSISYLYKIASVLQVDSHLLLP